MEHWCKYFTLAPKLHLPLSPPPVPSNPPLPRLLHLTRPHQFCLFKNTCFLPSSLLRSHSPSFLRTFSPRWPLTHSHFFFVLFFFCTVFLWLFFSFAGTLFFFSFFSPLPAAFSRQSAGYERIVLCVDEGQWEREEWVVAKGGEGGLRENEGVFDV